MKNLTDYWRAKYVELQKLSDEERKKSNSAQKELKDNISGLSSEIKKLQDKISELEKTVSEKEKIILSIEPAQNAVIEKHKKDTEKIKNENAENISSLENMAAAEEAVLISEFVRFLRKNIGYVDGLVRISAEIRGKKEAEKAIGNLLEHTDWITRFADELSWFSQPFKKEQGTTDPVYLLEKVAGEFKESAAAKNVRLEFDIKEKIPEADIFEEHLKTVFTEIIKNSLDAMPSGGTLTLKAAASPDAAGVIEFTDTGRGIPAHLIEKVTEPFFSTKNKVGFGLGMTRVRKILDAYGYRLDVSSEEDKGTTVKITL